MRAAADSSSSKPPQPQSSASAAAALLAPGFRFHPTDEELVRYYLKRRVNGRALALDAIAEVDLYKREPWELPGLSRLRSRDLEWYFFSPLDRKYANQSRTNRATVLGYWKTTGKDRSVCRGTRVVGMKKTLVYHSGRAPRGSRTNWVMHEYRLEDEQLVKSGIRQDAYVVCRIFQKCGAGPQNGAQYGAPFVEEEWNDEEEAADGLLIIPDGTDGGTIDTHDKNYLKLDAVLQIQDLCNQQERADTLLVDNDGKGSGNGDPPGDPTIFLDEILKDPSFIDDVVDYINQSDIQSGPTLIEESREQILSGDPPSQVDGYLEFNDLKDAEIMDYNTVKFVIQGGNGHLQQLETEFFDTTDLLPNEQELLQMSPVENNVNELTDYLNSSADGCDSYEQAHNPMVHSSITDQPNFEFDDEFLEYFDTVDDDLQHNFAGFPENMEHQNLSTFIHSNSKVGGGNGTTNMAIPQLPNADVGGVTSSYFPASDDQYMNKYQHIPVVPDVTMSTDSNKTVRSRLVNMLDSVTAPPAFAAEFPCSLEKYVGQISGTDQAGQLHLSPALIHLNDPEDWSLHKKGTADLLLSYSIADNVGGKSSGFGPFRKIQDWTLSLLLRGGCYHFFLSALVLSVGYKVGMCIYGK